MSPRAPRQIAERRGQRAELLALWLLRLKGYRLLARRYRVAVGEVDLIVRRRRVVVAVEVKARGEWAAASESIQPRQQRRIARALTQFVGGRDDLAGLDLRFDVMLVVPRRLPRHVIDAWRVEA